MTVHEILVKARNLIDQNWIKDGYVDADGGVCARGACIRATGHTPHQYRHYCDDKFISTQYILEEIIVQKYGFNVGVVSWNDEDERTKEDVLEVFDEAIRRTAPDPDVSFIEETPELVAA